MLLSEIVANSVIVYILKSDISSMKRSTVMIAIIIVAVLLVNVVFIGLYVRSENATVSGFESSNYSLPSIIDVPPVSGALPSNTTTDPPSGLQTMVNEVIPEITIVQDVYSGYGGVLSMNITNNCPVSIYVYYISIEWPNSGNAQSVYYKNTSEYISAGNRGDLGILTFGAPALPAGSTSGTYNFTIDIKFALLTNDGKEMYNAGLNGYTMGNGSITVLPLASSTGYIITANPEQYYNEVNSLINTTVVSSIVKDVQSEEGGSFNILQIAAAYGWIRDNIAYVEGTNGTWQSASQTLQYGTGNCIDQAILMASIIEALGGTARVNIINGHAFPTVLVATNATGFAEIEAALASYYGIPLSEFNVTYLQDQHGYWLVVDTVGFFYAGGLPALSEPTPTGWTPESSYIYTIDCTGRTVSTGLLNFL